MPFGFGKKSNAVEAHDTEAATPPSKNSLEKDGIAVDHEAKSSGSDNEHNAAANVPSEADARKEMKFLRKLHRFDPNLSQDVVRGMSKAIDAHDAAAEIELINLIENDSPYPEVRAAVRNYDEELPCNTIRMWVLGMVVVTLGSGMNALFSFRNPSISISSFVAELVSYPMGLGWDLIMPKHVFNFCGYRWSFNPHPFNIKEHTLIVIMANVTFSGGPAYAIDILTALKGFYFVDYGWGFDLVVTLATQMVGFGFAGILRKYLVWPAGMLWPSNFVNTSLFYALHDHTPTDPSKANGWSIARYRYFLYVFLGSFTWYWFPGFIFPALSYFTWICWIAPNNPVVNQLFGYEQGLGLVPITFDWTQVTGFTTSPLMFPWHAIANTLIGVLIFFVIVTCGVHYSGAYYNNYLPISDYTIYDRYQQAYNVSNILTPEYTLDPVKYSNYSPLFLSTTFSIAYGTSFAGIVAVVTHTALFHGQEIWVRSRLAFGEEPDVHTKMMRKYKEVPQWWFVLTFLITFALGFVSILVWDTHLTAWAYIIALIISIVFMLPIGMIQAITNIQLGLNVITEFIIGYMQPGRPLAMMLFKTYGYITMVQALGFVQDLKLGHYMKVPPRMMFSGQMIATVWSCIVQVAVLEWSFGAIQGICDPQNPHYFTCPGGHVFFDASVIWGLIGPRNIFSPGAIYNNFLYFFIPGFLAPAVFYFGARAFPNSSLRYINIPIIFSGAGQIPPAQVINYTTWGFVGFIFNKVIRGKYPGWWANYNYLTSAGLDTGLAISTIVIFLTLGLTLTNFPNWWGTTVFTETLDWQFLAFQTLLDQSGPTPQAFGPATW